MSPAKRCNNRGRFGEGICWRRRQAPDRGTQRHLDGPRKDPALPSSVHKSEFDMMRLRIPDDTQLISFTNPSFDVYIVSEDILDLQI